MTAPDLARAAESSFALVMTRLVMPLLVTLLTGMVTVGIALFAWMGDAAYSEIKAIRADMQSFMVEQGKHETKIEEHERRLNRLDIRSQRGGYELPR